MSNHSDDSFPFDHSQEGNYLYPDNPARQNEWVLDSGAAGNCTCNGDLLHDIESIEGRAIICADGGTTVTTIQGEVDMNGFSAKRVLYLPAIDNNLLSVGCLTKDDHVVVFDKHGFAIYNEGDVTVTGTVKARGRLTEDGLYKLNVSDNTDTDNLNLWHRRLCHIDITGILLLQDYMALGIEVEQNNRKIECLVPHCPNYFRLSNCPTYMSTFNFNNYPKATKALEVMYFYLSESQGNMSLNGNKYFIVFIDDYTRKTFVYFFKSEYDLIPKLKMFTKHVELCTGNKIKQMSTDLDVDCKKFYPYIDTYCMLNNINVNYSRTETAMIEWLRFYIVSKKLCLITDANLPAEYWAEVVSAVVNLLNVCPNTGLPFMTPQEAWSGLKPDLSVIRVFGCRAYLPCLKKYVINLGYDFDKAQYRFMDRTHHGVYFRKTAIFYEHVPYFRDTSKVVK